MAASPSAPENDPMRPDTGDPGSPDPRDEGTPAFGGTFAPVAGDPPVPAPASPSRIRSGAAPFALGAAAVVLVILLAGGTSWVVARASAAEPLPVSRATAPARHGGEAQHAARAGVVRGTVGEIDGSSWRITTARGESLSVTVRSATRFVDSGSAVSASAFHVGDSVVVAGVRSGSTIAARRIALPAPHPSPAPSAGA